jgi:hypothetical protein
VGCPNVEDCRRRRLARFGPCAASVSASAAAKLDDKHFEYKRREPQGSVLHQLVREHLEPFLAYTREHYRKPLPKYVERELRGFLSCGDLRAGFTRIRCPRCRREMFVGFSCGARTVCSSCSARRMAAASIHLCDRVLPNTPVRQWVLSVPYELRWVLASKAQVLSAVIRIAMRVVLGWYRARGRQLGLGRAETGPMDARWARRRARVSLRGCADEGGPREAGSSDLRTRVQDASTKGAAR